ncbi:MAG TPA: methylated-DNA--[protein]-cysteine S-methyltransferase [Atribacteraceae bacterium]|nr:methylated-DNA--[protein]-cysteine S-methyltransferase [Atribacteraceae bacterium]
MKQFYDTFHAFIGPVTLVMEEEIVKGIFLLPESWDQYQLRGETELVHDPILLRGPVDQMREYFQGNRQVFSFPVFLEGPEFTRQVWHAVSKIPYGQTRSYAEIASVVGKPTACRAVGQANRRNPLPIVIPCHRVIGSKGQLVGFNGNHTDVKQLLLDHERKYRFSSVNQSHPRFSCSMPSAPPTG